MAKRAVIFGLDAASPTLIKRWMDKLPTLKKLTQEGTWGVLHSTLPPFTSPAWSCMATGKNPAKIGIFGLHHRSPDSYDFIPPTSSFRKTPALWDLAGLQDKHVLVVNVPDTYPPTTVNGIMISGRPAPNNSGTTITYPSEMRSRIEDAVGRYETVAPGGFDDSSLGQGLESWVRVNESQQKTLEYLMEETQWDMLFYVSMAIDAISHHFWKYLDTGHPDYVSEAPAEYHDAILNIYQNEDQRLERIIQRLDEDDLLLVVSDHGSTPCHHHVAVNLWLIEHGYLVLKKENLSGKRGWLSPIAQNIFNVYRRSEWSRRMLAPLKNTALRNMMVDANFTRRTKGRLPFSALPVDWQHTKAYYLGDDRIYLNVAGREPEGIISAGKEYTAVREQLVDDLNKAVDPDSGQRLFRAAHLSEAIYDGPYLSEGPDIVLEPGNLQWNLGGAVGSTIVDRPVVSGKHHPDGVFFAWGADIRRAVETEAEIYDIAPTILHSLDLAIPEDCDGEVQFNWFREDSEPAKRPQVTTKPTWHGSDHYALTSEEEEQIETTLRNLGYLD